MLWQGVAKEPCIILIRHSQLSLSVPQPVKNTSSSSQPSSAATLLRAPCTAARQARPYT